MKKSICVLILAVFIVSCSLKVSDIPKNKMDYVRKAIVCDSKSTDYKIKNIEELIEFFDRKTGSVKVRYEFKEYKKSKYLAAKEVEIIRGRTRKEGKRFYLASFKRATFPFSDCRKLKTEPKYF